MIASRRRFLFGAGATAATLVAAPAIVRVAANLMPVKPLPIVASAEVYIRDYGSISFNELVTTTLRNRSHLLAEQVMKNNALLTALRDRNYIYLVDKSRLVYEPRSIGDNSPGIPDWLKDGWPTTA